MLYMQNISHRIYILELGRKCSLNEREKYKIKVKYVKKEESASFFFVILTQISSCNEEVAKAD